MAVASERVTDRQVSFAMALIAERVLPNTQENAESTLVLRERVEGLTKKAASDFIGGLLREKPIQVKPAPVAATLPEIPEGRYAIEEAGAVKFYKVDAPTQGKWAGYVFVKVLASDVEYPIRDKDSRKRIIDTIAIDPQAASARYGQEIGACGICGRTLTDEESRARGIGPICAGKNGWA